jgi:pantoate--beta-alanine ligase
MIVIKDIITLKQQLNNNRKANKSIGFVPTMGALHAGHISLIDQSNAHNDVTVCSIFVNPTQFNNAEDLKKYPKTLQADIDKLEKANCTFLFLPEVDEMYQTGETIEQYHLGHLETILEGKYRPGHFQGVCMIVEKLLHAVEPDILYLGRKDYQQCMVISKMMTDKKMTTILQICDTVREDDGLAMSSRNMRLNEVERKQALRIIESLKLIKDNIKQGDITELKKRSTFFLETNGYKVDYIEIADAETLALQNEWDGKRKLVVLVAAYLNEVRLIDNIVL